MKKEAFILWTVIVLLVVACIWLGFNGFIKSSIGCIILAGAVFFTYQPIRDTWFKSND